jgi:hypothetical protein
MGWPTPFVGGRDRDNKERERESKRAMKRREQQPGGSDLGRLAETNCTRPEGAVEKGRGGMLGVIVCEVHTERR